MKRGDHQRKIRPKLLYDLLLKETDEEHGIATNDIILKLREQGVSVDRKTLYEDIKLLNAYGFEVLQERGRTNYYNVVERSFDTVELKILMDAVEAARFITPKKTATLKKKIVELAARSGAEQLSTNDVKFDVVKLKNENIFYNIDTLDACIRADKKCSFLYFDYDFEGQRKYRNNSEPYVVSPLALLFSDENYYLLAIKPGRRSVSAFRVDRMDTVQMESPIAERMREGSLKNYRKKVFSMYAGEEVTVVMECDESYIDVIIDRFGFELTMLKLPSGQVRIKAEVALSPTFFGWLATSAGKVRLTAPQHAVQKYRDHLLTCLPSEEDIENAPKDGRSKEMRSFDKKESYFLKRPSEGKKEGAEASADNRDADAENLGAE